MARALIKLASLNGTNGFAMNGGAAGDGAGVSVSGAGEVNGDGFDDVIIGSSAGPNGPQSGQSYIKFGARSGFPASFDPSDLDGVNGFALNGVREYDLSGWSVSTAGDVNGDGLGDLIVGGHPAGDSGRSYVVFGSESGFAASFELSALDGSNGFTLAGGAEDQWSGSSVSAAGDVNGDGIDDVIVGSPRTDQSHVVFGSKSGFTARLRVSSLDGTTASHLTARIMTAAAHPSPPPAMSMATASTI